MVKATILAMTFLANSPTVTHDKELYQIGVLSGDEMFKLSTQMYLDENQPNAREESSLELDEWIKIIADKSQTKSN